LLASILAQKGGNLPSDLLRASLTNTKGFYESWHWVNANDQILNDIDLRWDSIIPSPDFIEAESFIKSKKDLIIKSIREGFSDHTDVKVPLVIKDPRLCRTFPIWEKALHEMKIKMNLLMPVRHPFEVIHSLVLRDNFSPIDACYIWIWNVVESIIFSKKQLPRFVLYEKVLENPVKYMSEVLSDGVDASFSNLIDKRLNHNSMARNYYNKKQEPFLTAMKLYERIQDSCTPTFELIEFCTRLRFHSQFVIANERKRNKRIINGLLKNNLFEKGQLKKTLEKEQSNESLIPMIKFANKVFSFLKK
jgi:hypothetical protein